MKKALELYNSIESIDYTQLTESDTQPMHPNLYFQLINISGFTNLNGKTYEEYYQKWKLRRSKKMI